MIKKCVFCSKDYEIMPKRGRSIEKSKYCSPSCHNDFWLRAVNKTGKSTKNNMKKGIYIRENFTLTNIQRDIMIGCILGDGTLGLTRKGSASFITQHTAKNKDYILNLKDIFHNFILLNVPTYCKSRSYVDKNEKVFLTKESYKINTVCHQDIQILNDLFYPKGEKRVKIFPNFLIKELNILTVLFWYMDDGCLSNKRINLHTNNFSYEDHIRIQAAFDKLGIKTKIYFLKSQNKYITNINTKNTIILMEKFKTYKDYIPKSMEYKFFF